MAGLAEFLFGSNDKFNKLSTETPQQEQFHNNLLQNAMQMQGHGQEGYQNAQNYYNNLFQPGNQAYENFAAPYMNQFQEQILPMLAERFAGQGALGSSAFGQALGGAGAGLQSQLAQLFAQLQSQAAGAQTNQYNIGQQQYGNLAQLGLGTQQFGYAKKPGNMGILGSLLAGAGGGLGGPLGAGIGNGIVGIGNGIGGGISNLFKSMQGGGLS